MSTTLLSKYNKIDRTRISATAAEVLADLKKETKNFTKVTADVRKEFNNLYDRISGSKPQAIKGTAEYKAFGKKEAKKAPSKTEGSKVGKYKVSKAVANKYKKAGVDIERDAPRQAKPFGARVKGKNKYSKPTAADYAAHRVYYEYRPNRADVRRKAPKLASGGALEEYKQHAAEHHRLG
jgi:hypothetical protein